jgi:hypothetical protein
MPRKTYPIADRGQLACLASAVRQEIVDTVQALGECSITAMAEALGRPADGLYYHVKALVECGLLVRKGTARNNRREEVIYSTPGSLKLVYRPGDRSNMKLICKIVDSLLNTAQRDFNAGFKSDLCRVEGERRNLWAGRSKGWLSREELAEVNELLDRLSALLNQPKTPEREHLLVLSWVQAPVAARSLRRS